MRVGSLFSGIGGLDLGLERAGMEIVWQVEWDLACQRILDQRWPDVPCYGDVHGVGADNLEPVDLICGGFPCQPVSVSGKRLAQKDHRWLWPEFARVVCELRPRFVLVENVPGLLARAMGDVLGDLAGLGFDAEWESVPASAVGAPHRRDRVFIVAYPEGYLWGASGYDGPFSSHGRGPLLADPEGECGELRQAERERSRGPSSRSDDVAHAEGRGEQEQSQGANPGTLLGTGARASCGTEPGRGAARGDLDQRAPADGGPLLAYPELDRLEEPRDGGIPRGPSGPATDAGWWATEPDVGRVADGVPHRVDRLRMLGNGVVPQVAQWIGERIMSAASQAPAKPRLSRSGQDEVAVAASPSSTDAGGES